jgi:DNA polymerase-4
LKKRLGKAYYEYSLTASAGISINKFIAKVASDYTKPNGQKIGNPEEILQFIEDLDI